MIYHARTKPLLFLRIVAAVGRLVPNFASQRFSDIRMKHVIQSFFRIPGSFLFSFVSVSCIDYTP